MTRQKYLQLIHIAAHHLKLDDATYYQMLPQGNGENIGKSPEYRSTGASVKRHESQRLLYPADSTYNEKAD